MIFPYMDTDLEKIIKDEQYLQAEHIKIVLYQILKALKYMQSANVIHRYNMYAIHCQKALQSIGLSYFLGIRSLCRINDPFDVIQGLKAS